MKATTICNNATLATKSRTSIGQRILMLFALLTLLGLSGPASFAQSLSDLQGSGTIRVVNGGISTFTLTGTSSLLNQFTCAGELQFTDDSLQTGGLNAVGIVVFRASNGDQLVGIVTLETDASGAGQIEFSFRHTVLSSDGLDKFASTGRFQYSLPNPVVKTANTDIIAVLMPLLIPSIPPKK